MIRNLKALGLALFAILAMGAMAAASASAQTEGEIYETNGAYPAHITGADVTATPGQPTPSLTGNEEVVECSETSYTSNLAAASKKITIIPTYNKCTSTREATVQPTTVTMNGCDYVFHDATTGAHVDEWNVLADVVCPTGKVIEIHKYSSEANHAAGTSNCTLTVGSQTGKTGAKIFEETDAAHSLRIEGTVHSIAVQTHGVCSFGFTLNINTQLHLSATVASANKAIGIKH